MTSTPDDAGNVVATGTALPSSANLNPKTAVVLLGSTVKLTPTTKTGYKFKGWTSSIPNALTPGTNNSVTFTMVPSLTVTATWVKNVYIAGAGTYAGLIKASGTTVPSNATEGMLRVNLNSNGAFSGSLVIDGASYPFTGSFDAIGSSVFGVAKTTPFVMDRSADGKNNLTLDLTYVPGTGVTGEITEVSPGTNTSSVTATKGIYTAATPVPADLLNVGGTRGTYTIKLTPQTLGSTSSPQGYGYATLTLSTSGTVSLSGLLADGTALSASGLLVEGQHCPVFAQLVTPGQASTVRGGSFSGTLTFDLGQDASDVTGSNLQWFRPAVVSAGTLATNLYTVGWPSGIKVNALGARFDSTVDVTTALALAAPDALNGNAKLTFSAGKLNSTITKTKFNIATGNVVTKIPTNDATYSLSLSASGLIGGSFTPNWPSPVAAKPVYRGIIIQKGTSAGGYGYFLSNANGDTHPEGGAVTLTTP